MQYHLSPITAHRHKSSPYIGKGSNVRTAERQGEWLPIQ